MEGYILGGRNIPESEFKERFKRNFGLKELESFERNFRNYFIQENDFKNIACLGANVIRVPFNCRLLESDAGKHNSCGFGYLEKVLSWAGKYSLKVILDLHAAWGAQNTDWHSDSRGQALFWTKKLFQQRTLRLWERIAERFKQSDSLLGYDVLNEPVPGQGKKTNNDLRRFYKAFIGRIRAIDREHIIFLEGDNYAQDVDFLKDLVSDKTWVSIHTYQPLNFVFNFNNRANFPGVIEGKFWDRDSLYQNLEPYFEFSQKNKAKIFVGEFGINWRGGVYGELEWLKSILEVFEDFDFGYTYWTYKALAGSCYPDGLYQYGADNKYINSYTAVCDWEDYLELWGREKEAIIAFWQTKNFEPNKKLIETLRRFFAKR